MRDRTVWTYLLATWLSGICGCATMGPAYLADFKAGRPLAELSLEDGHAWENLQGIVERSRNQGFKVIHNNYEELYITELSGGDVQTIRAFSSRLTTDEPHFQAVGVLPRSDKELGGKDPEQWKALAREFGYEVKGILGVSEIGAFYHTQLEDTYALQQTVGEGEADRRFELALLLRVTREMEARRTFFEKIELVPLAECAQRVEKALVEQKFEVLWNLAQRLSTLGDPAASPVLGSVERIALQWTRARIEGGDLGSALSLIANMYRAPVKDKWLPNRIAAMVQEGVSALLADMPLPKQRELLVGRLTDDRKKALRSAKIPAVERLVANLDRWEQGVPGEEGIRVDRPTSLEQFLADAPTDLNKVDVAVWESRFRAEDFLGRLALLYHLFYHHKDKGLYPYAVDQMAHRAIRWFSDLATGEKFASLANAAGSPSICRSLPDLEIFLKDFRTRYNGKIPSQGWQHNLVLRLRGPVESLFLSWRVGEHHLMIKWKKASYEEQEAMYASAKSAARLASATEQSVVMRELLNFGWGHDPEHNAEKARRRNEVKSRSLKEWSAKTTAERLAEHKKHVKDPKGLPPEVSIGELMYGLLDELGALAVSARKRNMVATEASLWLTYLAMLTERPREDDSDTEQIDRRFEPDLKATRRSAKNPATYVRVSRKRAKEYAEAATGVLAREYAVVPSPKLTYGVRHLLWRLPECAYHLEALCPDDRYDAKSSARKYILEKIATLVRGDGRPLLEMEVGPVHVGAIRTEYRDTTRIVTVFSSSESVGDRDKVTRLEKERRKLQGQQMSTEDTEKERYVSRFSWTETTRYGANEGPRHGQLKMGGKADGVDVKETYVDETLAAKKRETDDKLDRNQRELESARTSKQKNTTMSVAIVPTTEQIWMGEVTVGHRFKLGDQFFAGPIALPEPIAVLARHAYTDDHLSESEARKKIEGEIGFSNAFTLARRHFLGKRIEDDLQREAQANGWSAEELDHERLYRKHLVLNEKLPQAYVHWHGLTAPDDCGWICKIEDVK